MNRRARILLLCGTGHFYSHYFMLAYPTLALRLRHDLHLSREAALDLAFPMYLLFGLAAVPMGVLGDRMPNRRLLILMLLGMAGFALLAGAATSPFALQAALAGIGLMAAIYHPVGMSLISKCCERRGSALGNNGVWGSLGIALAPVLVDSAAQAFGWRTAFVLSALPALGVGLAFLALRFSETPVGEPLRSRARSSLLPPFLLLLCSMTLLGLIYRGTTVTMPVLMELRGPGVQEGRPIGFLVSLIYTCGILGQVLGGRVADRYTLTWAYLLFHLCALPCMLGLAWLSGLPLLTAGMAYVLLGLGMQPVENSLVAVLTPDRYRSLAYSLKFLLVFGVGALAVKLAKPALAAEQPQAVPLVQSAVLTLVVLTAAALVWMTRRHPPRNQHA